MTKPGPRIVTLDIETAPLQSYHWGLWDENVGLDQINDEWTILAFAAKVLGEDKVIFQSTAGRGKAHVRDDRELLDALWTVLNEADIVVTQNGRAFDLKKINARMLMHDMKPYSPVHVVDTKVVADRVFGFTSTRLAWMSKHMTDAPKSEHRAFPGFELWAECLKDNPKAWAEMKKYNIQDVVATEKLYLKMRPWIPGHPNVATYVDGTDAACPKCGSTSLQRRGTATTQYATFYRYRCNDCGGWARSRQPTNHPAKRRSLLHN